MNIQVLHKNLHVLNHQIQVLCSGVDIFLGLAGIFCKKKDAYSGDFYPAKPQSKPWWNRGREGRYLTKPREKSLKPPFPRHGGFFLSHPAQPGCLRYHLSGELCSLAPQKQLYRACFLQGLGTYRWVWACVSTCKIPRLLYKSPEGYRNFKIKWTDFAALHLT